MTPSPEPTARRRARRPWLPLLWLGFLFLLVELGAFVVLSVRLGSLPPGAELVDRQRLAASEPDDPLPRAEVEFGTAVHPYLGFLSRSGSSVSEFGVTINHPAFYAPDSPIYDRDPDTLVVGLAGGSVAERLALFGGAEPLAEGLGRIPAFAGKRLRFVLLAWGGCKQPQQLMALTYLYALGGHLDLLIELDGFNEVALHESENHAQGIAPVYPRGWFAIARRHELMPLLGVLEERRGARIAAARAALGSPLSRSSLHRLLWLLRDDVLARRVREVQDELRGYEPVRDEDEPRDLILDGPPTDADTLEGRLERLVAIWKQSSLQMQRLCAANGTRYVHVLQPNQYVAGSKPLSAEERASAYEPDTHPYAPLVVDGYPMLLEAARELVAEGVAFGDLTQVFADVEETLYIDSCCHVGPAGNALLGAAVADFVASTTP